MQGVELNHNGKIISVPVKDRFISIFIERVHDKFSIKFSGSDFEKDQSIIWYDSPIKAGDKIAVCMKRITEETPPFSIYSSEEMEDITANKISIEELNQIEMKNFRELEQVLKKRGLI